MPTVRTLVLMRHAKSAYPGGVSDHDRPLAARGQREAGLAGQWLRAQVPVVDEVLCSSAARTLQTVSASGIDAPIRVAADIYDAIPDAILGQIRETADPVHTLLVVGHAPGVPGLAMELAGTGAPEALDALRSRFPTAGIAVLESDRDWSQWGIDDARLVAFHIPRD